MPGGQERDLKFAALEFEGRGFAEVQNVREPAAAHTDVHEEMRRLGEDHLTVPAEMIGVRVADDDAFAFALGVARIQPQPQLGQMRSASTKFQF